MEPVAVNTISTPDVSTPGDTDTGVAAAKLCWSSHHSDAYVFE